MAVTTQRYVRNHKKVPAHGIPSVQSKAQEPNSIYRALTDESLLIRLAERVSRYELATPSDGFSEMIGGEFEVGERIGKGGTSQVYRVERDGEVYVAKAPLDRGITDRSADALAPLVNEMFILSHLPDEIK